ncbi:MAG: transposase [Paracoccaceae bacterium]
MAGSCQRPSYCQSVTSCPCRKRAPHLIQSTEGIGAVAATTILIEMPEIEKLRKKAVASLAGVAPLTRQSGRWCGQSFVQGCRKPPRDTLYLPAIVATQYNPDLKAQYGRMKAAGKPSKVAITAILRNRPILAKTFVKENREWSEIRA